MSKLEKNTNTIDFMGMYLREIGRVPLLTREQEIDYAQQVQQMMSLLEAKETLTTQLRREPLDREWAAHVHLTESELNKTRRYGQQAKRKMVEANLRLVVAIAKKYQKRNMELLDLIQEGSIGLGRAVDKFDPTRGWKFSTYAYWWIRQAITRTLAQNSRTIRLPIHITEKLNKIKKVQQKLTEKLGRTPSVSEIAQAVLMKPQQVHQILGWARSPLSLNMYLNAEQDIELGDLLVGGSALPEDVVEHECLTNDLQRLLSELTPQQRSVVALRFGLVDGEALTLAKIGDRLNISRERVRQLERLALNKLNQRSEVLQDYR